MLSELSNQIDQFIETSKIYFPSMLIAMGALWALNILNWITGSHLNRLGIYPRHLIGLIGIPLAPFLHGNFNHLLFNSVPLFFLGIFIMSFGVPLFYLVTAIIVILSGLSVWFIGRRGIHIGASALISGYFGFILATAYENPTFATLFCAAVAFYYFGGILLSLLPTSDEISWEGHLTGFLSGIAAMLISTRFPISM